MTGPLTMVFVGIALVAVLVRDARRAGARDRVRGLRPGPAKLPPRVRAILVDRLARADLDLTPEAAVRWWILGVVGVSWFALLLLGPLVVPAVVGAVVAGPVALRVRAGHADRRARAALPDVLDHVVAQVRAGGTVTESVHVLTGRAGPLASDLRRISARLRLGAPLVDALAAWADERPVAGVRAAAGALTMVTTVGGSAAGPLEGLAASLRADEAAAGEARALSAQARVSAAVVGLAPLAYLAFSTMADPASARVLVATNPGRLCLLVGLALEALAAVWMRALVRAT
jgi:tight adherence protein B